MAPNRRQAEQPANFSTALLSGASRGIGKAVAIRIAAMGYGVFLLGRDTGALEAVVAQCEDGGTTAGYLAGDVSDPTYLEDAVRHAEQQMGTIDVLINNAGMSSRGAVQDADLDAWAAVLDVNFTSAMRLSQHVLPAMIERQRGAIINISSILGRNTNAGAAIYSASKHAMNGFAGCLFEDAREFGVKVSTIMPGFVDTALTAELGMNAQKMIGPDDIADAIQYVLSSSPACCPTEIVIRPQYAP